MSNSTDFIITKHKDMKLKDKVFMVQKIFEIHNFKGFSKSSWKITYYEKTINGFYNFLHENKHFIIPFSPNFWKYV